MSVEVQFANTTMFVSIGEFDNPIRQCCHIRCQNGVGDARKGREPW